MSMDNMVKSSWTASTDMIETTSCSARPDENWSHVDTNGHTVTWANAQWVETDRWTVYDEDYGPYEDYSGEYRCPECGEAVEPRWKAPSADRTFVEGLRRLTGTLELSMDAPPPEPGTVLALPIEDKTVSAVVCSVRGNGQAWVVEVEATGPPS